MPSGKQDSTDFYKSFDKKKQPSTPGGPSGKGASNGQLPPVDTSALDAFSSPGGPSGKNQPGPALQFPSWAPSSSDAIAPLVNAFPSHPAPVVAPSDPFMNMNLNPTLPTGSDSPFAGIGDYENALGMGPTVYTGGGRAAPGSAPPPNSSNTKKKPNGPVQG